MKTSIFLNLAVKDLARSRAFFEGLGYSFNEQFSNDQGASLVIDENIFVMLLTEEFFKTFTSRELVDTKTHVEALTALSAESRDAVNAWADKALALGATENEVPDVGQGEYMYSRSINDLDGHTWELVWMDPSTIQ